MASRLNDAIELSQRLAIAAAMKQLASDYGDNRVAQAIHRESMIAENLKKVLAVLRNEGEHGQQQLVSTLKQEEQKLATIRNQLSHLRLQRDNSEQQSSRNQQQFAQLSKDQQQTRQSIEQLSRELKRLQAEEAANSTQSAARKLGENDKPQQPNPQPIPPTDKIKGAETDLKKAADQLAARRQQAENDLATEFLRRFQTELTQMVQRQETILKRTRELDAPRKSSTKLSPRQINAVVALADEERRLAELAQEHSEVLFGLGAVRIGLEDAERRLISAAKFLDEHHTDEVAQQAEKLALVRLEAMMQAFAQTANEASPKQNASTAQKPSAPGNQPQQQPRKPTIELLEVKMLRMLQADLNERTHRHETRLAQAGAASAADPSFALEARELVAEQGRLAELVQQMITRNNEMQAP
jgi:hypothetical protein